MDGRPQVAARQQPRQASADGAAAAEPAADARGAAAVAGAPDATGYAVRGGVVSLSGDAVRELLTAVVSRGAAFRFTARGASMRPFILDGDVLTVSPVHGSGPRVGDVVAVTMCRGGTSADEDGDPETSIDALLAADCDGVSDEAPDRRLVVHRVVARRGERCLIRGDSCPQPDGWFPRLSIAGVVTRVERDGRPRKLGVGRLGQRLAWLSSRGRLTTAVGVARAPRRAVGASLRAVQRLPAYRSGARRMGRRVVIDPATDDDLLQLGRRFGLVVPPTGVRRAAGSTLLVARLGGSLVGFVEFVHREEEGAYHGDWLHALTVRTPWRGMGIATLLVAAVEELAREHGARELLLTVDPGNRAALALYRKLGFRPVEEGVLADHLREVAARRGAPLTPLRRELAGPEPVPEGDGE
jgi:ribosomal-protein-alanine N-acetyltransferase